ncbi:MAG: hypothetical protein ACRDTS_25090 [Mycobacterium sp.]
MGLDGGRGHRRTVSRRFVSVAETALGKLLAADFSGGTWWR